MIIGKAQIKNKIECTSFPRHRIFDYDIEKDYYEALVGKVVNILSISSDGDSFLVLAKGEKSGHFIWQINKNDILGFTLNDSKVSFDGLIERVNEMKHDIENKLQEIYSSDN